MKKNNFIKKLYRTICICLIGLCIYGSTPFPRFPNPENNVPHIISTCSDKEDFIKGFKE
ncbi:MAG: hypothetical protein IJ282_00545 [Lachnospiraceae bacterium]|nr:hypothetical protein [Lachnospiraceae bacterium]